MIRQASGQDLRRSWHSSDCRIWRGGRGSMTFSSRLREKSPLTLQVFESFQLSERSVLEAGLPMALRVPGWSSEGSVRVSGSLISEDAHHILEAEVTVCMRWQLCVSIFGNIDYLSLMGPFKCVTLKTIFPMRQFMLKTINSEMCQGFALEPLWWHYRDKNVPYLLYFCLSLHSQT